MSGYFDDTNLPVTDGNVAKDSDLNNVISETDAAFDEVEQDVIELNDKVSKYSEADPGVPVVPGEYSAKHYSYLAEQWAIGTPVDNTLTPTGDQSAKQEAIDAAGSASDASDSAALSSEWAQKTGSTVDGSGYSAKHWAEAAETTVGDALQDIEDARVAAIQDVEDEGVEQVGLVNSTGATQVAAVNAEGTTQVNRVATEGQTYVDLAKDWAIKTDGPVEGGDFSSLYWAEHAESQASISTSNAATATTEAIKAEAAADRAEDAASLDISQIRQVISNYTTTIEDVKVFYLKDDSDGGAWAERTEHLSWHKELGRFPKVFAIVLTSTKMFIHNLTETDPPLWAQFDGSTANMLRISGAVNSGVDYKDGKIVVSSRGWRVKVIDFVRDEAINIGLSGTKGKYRGNISQRNDGLDVYNTGGGLLPTNTTNDAKFVVDKDAPVSPETGLPDPYIVMASDEGVKVTNYADLAWHESSSTDIMTHIEYLPEMDRLVFIRDRNRVQYSDSDWRVDQFTHLSYTQSTDPAMIDGPTSMANQMVGTEAEGCTLIHHNPVNKGDSMVADINSVYNTGWKLGVPNGVWLSDSTAEFIGEDNSTNLIDNGTIDPGAGWSTSAPVGSVTFPNGTCFVENGTANSGGAVYAQQGDLTPGKTYRVIVDVESFTTYCVCWIGSKTYELQVGRNEIVAEADTQFFRIGVLNAIGYRDAVFTYAVAQEVELLSDDATQDMFSEWSLAGATNLASLGKQIDEDYLIITNGDSGRAYATTAVPTTNGKTYEASVMIGTGGSSANAVFTAGTTPGDDDLYSLDNYVLGEHLKIAFKATGNTTYLNVGPYSSVNGEATEFYAVSCVEVSDPELDNWDFEEGATEWVGTQLPLDVLDIERQLGMAYESGVNHIWLLGWAINKGQYLVQSFNTAGTRLTNWQAPFGCQDIEIDPNTGDIWLIDNTTVYKYDQSGTVLTSWAPGIGTDGNGITHDGTHLWISDGATDTIAQFTEAGVATGTTLNFNLASDSPGALSWHQDVLYVIGVSGVLHLYDFAINDFVWYIARPEDISEDSIVQAFYCTSRDNFNLIGYYTPTKRVGNLIPGWTTINSSGKGTVTCGETNRIRLSRGATSADNGSIWQEFNGVNGTTYAISADGFAASEGTVNIYANGNLVLQFTGAFDENKYNTFRSDGVDKIEIFSTTNNSENFIDNVLVYPTSNLVAEENFAETFPEGDSTIWTLGTGWSTNNGRALSDGSGNASWISQAVGTAGKRYRGIVVADLASGSFSIGNTNSVLEPVSTTGKGIYIYEWTQVSGSAIGVRSNNFSGEIQYASFQEVVDDINGSYFVPLGERVPDGNAHGLLPVGAWPDNAYAYVTSHNGKIRVIKADTSGTWGWALQTLATPDIGATYQVSVDFDKGTNSYTQIVVFDNQGALVKSANNFVTDGRAIVTFKATTATSDLRLYCNSAIQNRYNNYTNLEVIRLPAEVIEGGDFEVNDGIWTIGDEWDIPGGIDGKATKIGTTIQSVFTSVQGKQTGKRYRVTFKVSNSGAGTIEPRIGGSPITGGGYVGDGWHSQIIIAGTANSFLSFVPTSTWNGDLQYVRCVELADNDGALRTLENQLDNEGFDGFLEGQWGATGSSTPLTDAGRIMLQTEITEAINIYQAYATEEGKSYTFSAELTGGTAGVRLIAGTTNTNASYGVTGWVAAGNTETKTLDFVAESNPSYFVIQRQTSDPHVNAFADNVQVYANRNFVHNYDFNTIDGWDLQAGQSIIDSVLRFDGSQPTTTIASQPSTFKTGDKIIVEVNVSAYTIGTGMSAQVTGVAPVYISGTGTFTKEIEVVSDNPDIVVYGSDDYIGDVDYVRMYAAEEPDRALSGNNLQVLGLIEKSKVATSADLVGYGPFNTGSDKLVTAVDPDMFRYEANDFYYSCWLKPVSSGDQQWHNIMGEDDSAYLGMYMGFTQNGGADHSRFSARTGGTVPTSVNLEHTDTAHIGAWTHYFVRRVGLVMELWVDGVFRDTQTLVAGSDLFNCTEMAIGGLRGGDSHSDAEQALLKTGRCTVSDDQIRKIYDDEKKLFEENGKCLTSIDVISDVSYNREKDAYAIANGTNIDLIQNLSWYFGDTPPFVSEGTPPVPGSLNHIDYNGKALLAGNDDYQSIEIDGYNLKEEMESVNERLARATNQTVEFNLQDQGQTGVRWLEPGWYPEDVYDATVGQYYKRYLRSEWTVVYDGFKYGVDMGAISDFINVTARRV